MMQTQVIKDGLMRIHHWFAYTLGVLSLLTTIDARAENPFSPSDSAVISLDDPSVEGASYDEQAPGDPGANPSGPEYGDPDAAPYGPYDPNSPAPLFMAPGAGPIPYGPPPGPGYGPQGVPLDGGFTQPVAPGSYPQEMGPWPRISPYDNNFDEVKVGNNGLWERTLSNEGRQWHTNMDYLLWNVAEPRDNLIGAPGIDVPINSPFDFVTMRNGVDGAVGNPGLDLNAIGEERSGPENHQGFRVGVGFWNDDNTGWEWEGWHLARQEWFFKRGIGQLDDDPFDLFPSNPDTVRVTAAIPMFILTPDPLLNISVLTPTAVPFDQYFRIALDSSAGGSNMNFFMSPIFRGDYYEMRFFGGLRYMYLDENFSFHGIDSGRASTFFPDGTPAVDLGQVVSPYESRLNSSVFSNLFGPQVGMHFGLGGKILKLSGKTSLALLINHEQYELDGIAIGDPYNDPGFDRTLAFAQEYSTTHLSPAVEQTLNLDIRIFQYVPVLRRMHIMEQATLRLGASAMAIGEIARPQNQIVWVGQPLTPYLRVNRSDWFSYGVNAGIHWDF